MEPVFRPFCPRFRTLPTFVTLSLRTFKTSARCIRRPQTACFGSQTMCPFCGFTSRSKEFCLECGKPFPAGEKKRCNGAKVYRHSDSIRASDPVRDCWPYKGKPILPRCWGKVAVHIRHHRTRPAGAFRVLKPQHLASMRKRGDAL